MTIRYIDVRKIEQKQTDSLDIMQTCFRVVLHICQKFAVRADFQNVADNPLIHAVFVHLLNQISDSVLFKPLEFLIVQAPDIFDGG